MTATSILSVITLSLCFATSNAETVPIVEVYFNETLSSTNFCDEPVIARNATTNTGINGQLGTCITDVINFPGESWKLSIDESDCVSPSLRFRV